MGLFDRVAACFKDHRDPRLTGHSVRMLVAQRITGIALGYEDQKDHDDLRQDPLLALLAGGLDIDATDDEVHDRQEGRSFHGHYGHYCFLPLYITCGGRTPVLGILDVP